MKKLLAVDGNSILNRAFYGVKPLTTRDGFPTNALFGLINIVAKQAEAIRPDLCAVAFDRKEPTFRHKMYDEYKAGRRPMPDELVKQLPIAKELFAAMGYTVIELPGYEADDILGTLASLCEAAGGDAYLLTGDRDALQLIDEHVRVLLATNTETLDMDEGAFYAKYGVKSSQYLDVKALMGDSSDHIPGVPGVGEKTAFSLISQFSSLDGVYAALPDADLKPSVRAHLTEGRESAYLSRKLAEICKTAPIGLGVDDLADGTPARAELKKLFLRLEFSQFIKRFALDSTEETAHTAVNISIEKTTADKVKAEIADRAEIALDQTDGEVLLSDGERVWSIPKDSDLAHLLAGKIVVCFDCKSLYKQEALQSLRDLPLFDLMLAAYLDNSSKNDFSADSLVADYLGESADPSIPPVWYYLRVYAILRERLDESGQSNLLEEIEMPLAAVLADMETAGFRIDRAGIAAYGEHLSAVAAELEARIFLHAGKEFNVNSPKQLGEVLFDTLKLPHAKKTKTGYSTNADILEKLRPYHPIIEEILDYRQVTKLKSTYADGLLKVADEGGRVHTTFKQTGTATGRLSSTEPNLQNIPIRTELGREFRRFFLPENEDYVIVDADYSQIELRLLAHISRDAGMIGAFLDGADIHTSTAATVFGVDPANVTPEMRKRAKAVNFGILYGIGAFSLADDLGISRARAQEYIDSYLESYPGIDAYLKNTIAQAYRDGYVTTLFGRRRYIPELAGTNKVQQKFGERVAMNSPIQGTAADVIKTAMIRVHRRLKREGIDARLILQVHDELLIEAHRSVAKQAERILKEEMENAVHYSVPLTVDIHTGNTWYEAK